MNAIKTAIIVDFMGSSIATADEEVINHTEYFSSMLERPLNVHTPRHALEIEAGTELVIFDFGGMMPGCDSLISSNARALFKWAQDNPNGLVVIVSWFTWMRYIEAEMEDLGLTLVNITHSDRDDFDELVPEWWRAGLKK